MNIQLAKSDNQSVLYNILRYMGIGTAWYKELDLVPRVIAVPSFKSSELPSLMTHPGSFNHVEIAVYHLFLLAFFQTLQL